MKIIIVDDNKKDIWEMYDKLLELEKMEYHAFKKNVLNAVEYLQKNQDVVGAFIDLVMPEISGDLLAEQLIKINPKLKIVFYTGYTVDEEGLKKRFSKNLLGFCYKPLNSHEFSYYLNQMIDENAVATIQFCMYGIFDVFINGKLMDFYCAKSKELLALLVVYQGRSVSKSVIIEHLWMNEERKNVEALYRDARWKLRDILNSYHIGNIISSGKGDLSLILQPNMKCDYWDKLKQGTHNQAIEEEDVRENVRNETFLVEYDWADEY